MPLPSLLALAAFAHPGADEAVRASAAALAASPCDAEIWLGRARAFAGERRADEALAAVDRAEACGADALVVELARGVALAGAGRDAEALHHLEAALARDPEHAGARLLRSRLLAAAGRTEEAASDAERALARIPLPQPDDVLHLARLFRKMHQDERALAAIDRALPSPALVEEAVALEVELGRPEGALGRLEAMPASEHWLLLYADILETVDVRQDGLP